MRMAISAKLNVIQNLLFITRSLLFYRPVRTFTGLYIVMKKSIKILIYNINIPQNRRTRNKNKINIL